MNITGIKEITGLNNWYYMYGNYQGTYTSLEIPSQGRMFNRVVRSCNYERFREKYPGSTDTIVYRMFDINPLKFWRWYEYIVDWRYTLPYERWEDVKQRRGFDKLRYSNGLAEF